MVEVPCAVMAQNKNYVAQPLQMQIQQSLHVGGRFPLAVLITMLVKSKWKDV